LTDNEQNGSLRVSSWRTDAAITLGYLLLAIITQTLFKTIAVWPAAGVAIVSAILLGNRAVLGVLLGSIMSNTAWANPNSGPSFTSS
jgi:hypothetical protein